MCSYQHIFWGGCSEPHQSHDGVCTWRKHHDFMKKCSKSTKPELCSVWLFFFFLTEPDHLLSWDAFSMLPGTTWSSSLLPVKMVSRVRSFTLQTTNHLWWVFDLLEFQQEFQFAAMKRGRSCNNARVCVGLKHESSALPAQTLGEINTKRWFLMDFTAAVSVSIAEGKPLNFSCRAVSCEPKCDVTSALKSGAVWSEKRFSLKPLICSGIKWDIKNV